jgi:hypothetical protein
MNRAKITNLILWLWVLAVTFLMGGGVFEHSVLTPIWAGSPPESVTSWPHGVAQARFFGIVTPVILLISLAMLIAASWMPPRVRKWALFAGLSFVAIGISSAVFFVPILQKTIGARGAGLSPEEITTLANQFVMWNWARWILMIGAWAAGLRALTLSRQTPLDRRNP